RRPFDGKRLVDVDDHEIEAVEASGPQHFARHLAAVERELATNRARRGVRAQLADRERTLLENPQHLGAHHAGGAHQPDSHDYSLSIPIAACNERTARSTSSSATTHEIRIVDV